MKKTICLILAVIMLFALAACGESKPATSPDAQNSGSPTDIEIPEATPTPEPQPVTELYVCGAPLVKNGQLTGMGYKGATYEEGKLTLEDATLAPDNGNDAIYFTGDLEIVLKGKNTLTGVAKSDGNCFGINAADILDADGKSVSSANLIISGDGSLVINATSGTAESDGIWCSGKITIKSGNIDITAATHAIHDGAELVTDDVTVGENSATRFTVGNVAV